MHCTFWINEYLLFLSVCVCVCVVGGRVESNGIFRKNKMDYDKNLSDYRLCKHMYYRSYTKCIHISFNSLSIPIK